MRGRILYRRRHRSVRFGGSLIPAEVSLSICGASGGFLGIILKKTMGELRDLTNNGTNQRGWL